MSVILVKEDILSIVAEVLKIDQETMTIEPDESLLERGMTSIQAINMVVLLEGKYGIEIERQDLLFEKFDTINKILALLNRYLNE